MQGESKGEGLADEYCGCRVPVVCLAIYLVAAGVETWIADSSRDRRKLTFYFKADRRVDFRDLTKENFRIFKSRIWMSMVPKDGECFSLLLS